MMTPPRIAYLTGQYPLVSLTFIQREIAALRALGADIHTVAARQTPEDQHKGPEGREAAASTHYLLQAARNPVRLLRAQISALRAPGRYFSALALALRLRTPGIKSFLYQLIYFIEATLMALYVREKQIAHIHSHFVTSGTTVALLTSELTGVPYSFTLHGPADLFEHHRWRLDVKTARAKFVATISHFARSQLMFFSDPAHWHKIRIIHCGVMPDLYSDPNQGDSTPEAGKTGLVFVGRLAPVKGLRVLFEALEDLMPRYPDLHLTVVGDGPDRARLEATAQKFGDQVTFTGYMTQAEVSAVFRENDICVLPSFAEGVPVVLMEALASARPVVATQVAGVGELVEDGVTGYLVPPGDAESLARKIEILINNKDLRDKFGAEGRRRVQDDFDVHKEAERLLKLFSDTAGDSIRPPL